jgi:hypothetical protein
MPRSKRVALVGYLFFAAAAAVGFGPSVALANHTTGCSTSGTIFAGDLMGDSVRFGAQGDFPGTDPDFLDICVGGNSTFSSVWVALESGTSPLDIIQIGLDHCRFLACPYPEDGLIHYFWAWGRDHTSAGCSGLPDRDPIAIDLGVWDGSPHQFRVRKVTSSGVSTYRVYRDGVQAAPSVAASDVCWAGQHAIPTFLGEVFNWGDAVGGSATSKFRIDNTSRQDTVGGSWVNTFWQTPCAADNAIHNCAVVHTITLDLWAAH